MELGTIPKGQKITNFDFFLTLLSKFTLIRYDIKVICCILKLHISVMCHNLKS